MKLYILSESEARIQVSPSNTTVCEGSSISLKCATDTDFKLRWFRVYGNGTKERVYSGRKLYNETLYGINTTGKGQFDLVIKSASLELAGTYECVEQETHNQSAAEVIISGIRASKFVSEQTNFTLLIINLGITNLGITVVTTSGYGSAKF